MRCSGDDGCLRGIQWDLRQAPAGQQIYAVARDVTGHHLAERDLARANEILSPIILIKPFRFGQVISRGGYSFGTSPERKCSAGRQEIFSGEAPDRLPVCGGSDAKNVLAGREDAVAPQRRIDQATSILDHGSQVTSSFIDLAAR
jgi:hypothetical protein